jgi:hypothetical protein
MCAIEQKQFTVDEIISYIGALRERRSRPGSTLHFIGRH